MATLASSMAIGLLLKKIENSLLILIEVGGCSIWKFNSCSWISKLAFGLVYKTGLSHLKSFLTIPACNSAKESSKSTKASILIGGEG